MLLASSRGVEVPQIATNLGCAQQTVRDAIHAFNEKGRMLWRQVLTSEGIHAAFDEQSAEAWGAFAPLSEGVRPGLSLWTLEMAAEVAFEEGLTQRRVSGESIRATLARLLGVRWMRAKRWITSPQIPCTKEKKKARPTDGRSCG